MSKDKACISAVEEVCKRCHLYKENCGMLDFPDQCSESGRYIDGYRQAEKDLELTWEDMRELHIIFAEIDVDIELCKADITAETLGYYQEVLKRFRERKEK